MVQEKHMVRGKLVKTIFKQIIDDKDDIEKLLSIFPAMKKYSEKNVKFIQVNCKFVMKRKKR